MKTSEFIKQFNKLYAPIYIAERKGNEKDGRSVVIKYFDYRGKSITNACLTGGNTGWNIEGGIFSADMLELMAELAKTPPKERQGKFVILNSVLRHNQHWDYFKIGDKNQYLILCSTRDPEVLKMDSYTLEELEKEKRWLPEKWRNAIDSMLTPLDVALEEGKA